MEANIVKQDCEIQGGRVSHLWETRNEAANIVKQDCKSFSQL